MTICGNDGPRRNVRLNEVINSSKIPIGAGVNVAERDILRAYHETFSGFGMDFGDYSVENVLDSASYVGFKQGFLGEPKKNRDRSFVDTQIGYSAGTLARESN